MGTAGTVVTITFTKGRFIMAWQSGPLPKDTYGWGGVVPFAGVIPEFSPGGGFLFADFHGDKVVICPGGKELQPHEVAMFDNCLTLPPDAVGNTPGHKATRLGGH
jgi:hypothetical protein